jgi:hypothetical protein
MAARPRCRDQLRVASARLPVLDGSRPERGVEHAVVAAFDDDIGILAV